MSNTFNLVGTLSLPKETEKFKPYTQRTSASGWQMDKLRFNATCGDNRHMLSVDSGFWADGHGVINSFTKGGTADDGTKIKGEKIQIAWKDRLTDPRLAEVAEFKKFIVDTEVFGRRYLLQNAMDKIKEGKEISEEDLKAMGVEPACAASIGDQIFTDVWAAKNTGAYAFLVPPIKDKTTLFFKTKRLLERPIIKRYKKIHGGK